MKSIINLGLIFCILFVAASLELEAATFKAESYTSVESKTLKLKPEDYRNKKIYYEGLYTSTQTTFPAYAERNGIKAGKYFWLVITPDNLPVIVRKGKNLDDAVMALKRGSTVKVYGKVRKFKYQSKHTVLPYYYLELAHIEVVKEPEKELPERKDRFDKFRKNIRDFRDRRRN